MNVIFLVLKLCAGVGMFLLAMYLLEESLKNLSGRRFKIFLKKFSKNIIGAVAGGAFVTGILQSSSMVSLMVLAFVGAGVFEMKNALGIILGANLGTTLDSWLVATVGFKTNIEVIAYPAVFIGSLLLVLFAKRALVKNISMFLIGFGLLFIGLSFMKNSMELQVESFDFAQYINMPMAVFVVIGFIITLIVQSSSVTMALTLTALHAGAITFPLAALIVLGSETGTTIKLVLSGIGGTASKKRVVLGNLLFNIFLTLFAFIFLKSILFLITDILNIENSLIRLVTFSSLINLMSIILFIPILKPFVKFLELFFKDSDATVAAFIGEAQILETESSLDLFKLETSYFLYNSMLFNLELLGIDANFMQVNEQFKGINKRRKYHLKSIEDKYEFLKILQGELQLFYVSFRAKVNSDKLLLLTPLISSVRNCMYSIKTLHDSKSSLDDLLRSSKDIKYDFFNLRKNQAKEIFKFLNSTIEESDKLTAEAFKLIYDEIESNYFNALKGFYTEALIKPVDGLDTTTVINFNSAVFASNRAMVIAVAYLVLTEKEVNSFV